MDNEEKLNNRGVLSFINDLISFLLQTEQQNDEIFSLDSNIISAISLSLSVLLLLNNFGIKKIQNGLCTIIPYLIIFSKNIINMLQGRKLIEFIILTAIIAVLFYSLYSFSYKLGTDAILQSFGFGFIRYNLFYYDNKKVSITIYLALSLGIALLCKKDKLLGKKIIRSMVITYLIILGMQRFINKIDVENELSNLKNEFVENNKIRFFSMKNENLNANSHFKMIANFLNSYIFSWIIFTLIFSIVKEEEKNTNDVVTFVDYEEKFNSV
ncbi:hypothetical protein NUSPORA_01993 [Nucleospora cyclopteri]